jgi:1-deoxy-D-xylulose-5-phosphate reductoisomerase
MATNICLLGATGSIGNSTLGVLAQHPDLFKLHSIAAHSNWEQCLSIARQHQVHQVCMFEAEAAEKLSQAAPDLQVYSGVSGLVTLVTDGNIQVVVNGLVGSVGCLPTLEAVRHSKTVALANKETMVMAGPVIRRALAEFPQAKIVPVDSEHNAIFQCLADRPKSEVEQLILTASGGPFRNLPAADFAKITVAQALKHPTWSMGPKITIDSASMMNKGLEVIEAHFLFDIPYADIKIVVHPQSIIHSLVQFRDGSLMAQLGVPDMKIPIQTALTWPARLPLDTGRVNLAEIAQLDLLAPDFERFQCLGLAYAAGNQGGTAPAILNAANEVLVAAFLNEEISFNEIPQGIAHCLKVLHQPVAELTLADAIAADEQSRQVAREFILSKQV